MGEQGGDARAAVLYLAGLGYFGIAQGQQRSMFAKRAFNSTSLAIWTRQLSGLVSAGLPLERALFIFEYRPRGQSFAISKLIGPVQ